MRILHTADWHLGKKLEHLDRAAEHELFLSWMLTIIEEKDVDALLIAGDIFDTGSPSNETQSLYFNFLRRLLRTRCRQVVIVGGNHDSPSTLNAPRQLLKAFDIHVVGGVPEKPEEQIIPLTDATGQVQAVVVAVPFLRDRDVRLSVAGETATEREQRLRDGILKHYTSLLTLAEEYHQQSIPLLATGHLFAAGATASDSEKDIHVGSLGQFPATLFPMAFVYIALGHLHRPQVVGGQPHIRYSGSPIPLSFSECTDTKMVLLLEAKPGEAITTKELPIPCWRPLLRVSGTPEEVKRKLFSLAIPAAAELPAWIEIQVQTDSLLADLGDELQPLISDKPWIEHLFIRQVRSRDIKGIAEQNSDALDLVDMDPAYVFALRCQSIADDHTLMALEETFKEALQLMEEQKAGI